MVQRGFTLVELLVVIAIIAILAAILFPVFARAREKARQASCLSNVKQIVLGELQYAQDYGERFPYFLTNPARGEPWWNAIQPYLRNEDIYGCPSYPRPAAATTYSGKHYPYPRYGMNQRMLYDWNNCGFLGAIMRPAEIVLIGDCCHGMGDAWRIAWPNAPGGSSSSPRKCDVARNEQNDEWARHNGGNNLGFVDGHAKWMAGKAFYSQRNRMYYDADQ